MHWNHLVNSDRSKQRFASVYSYIAHIPQILNLTVFYVSLLNFNVRWLLVGIMSNGILASVLKQGDGHVPSTWTVAGRYFRESMKNPRLNGHNRTMLISRFIVRRTEDFYSFKPMRSVRTMFTPLRWKSERKNGRARAPFSQVYEIREIQFDGEFALNGPGSRLTPNPSRTSTRSAGMCRCTTGN